MRPRRAAPSADAGEAPRPAPNRWGLGHIAALDGLRGAAVVAVLLYHGGYLTGGYLGVDLFFVLSGFLITSLLLAEHRRTGRIKLTAFWLRRARRLLPAVFLLLFGVAIYAVVWARPIDLGAIRSSGIGAVFYVANWQQIIHGTNYWDISLAPSPLQHVWSLAIEEQFYLLWPLVIWAILRRGGAQRGRRVQYFCLVLGLISAELLVAFHAFGFSDTRLYQGTDTRAAALLFGAALAGWHATNGPIERHRWADRIEVAGIAATVALAGAWLFLKGTSPILYWGGLPVCSALAVLVVWAATNRRSPVVARIFSVTPLCWLGTVSYGLYLWHWPIYLVLNEARTGLSGLTLLAVRIVVSLAVATASFHLVEQPIRQNGLRTPLAKIGAPIGALAAVIALLLATTGAVAPAAVNQIAAPTVATQTISGAPRLMVVGDSVGNSVAGPMIDDPWSFGVNPINQTEIGCQLMFKGHLSRYANGTTFTRPDCTATYRQDVRRYAPNVVLVFFGGANSGEVRIGGSFVSACSPTFAAEQRRLHGQAIDDLRSNGAKVVLVTLARSDSSFSPPSWNQNVDCYNRELRSIADSTGVDLIDLDGWLCPGGTCRSELDGAPVRPDGLHFNGAGGRQVVEYLVEEALAAAGLKPSASAAKVPTFCPDIRHAVSPILDVLGGSDAAARRSSLARLKYVDLAQVAGAAPSQARGQLKVLADGESALTQVLASTPNGTALTTSAFAPATSAALSDLNRYLAKTCTGR